ncbi:MAG: helix-turn-helix transcriptional regulator [Myxococcota bacterium]
MARNDSMGAFLRRTRVARAMSVGEIARATRIPTAAIERIEADHFDDLPGEVFTRGFLKAYARAVGLSPEDVLARYTASRRAVAVEPLPVATPVQQRGKGRFGVAVAFVLLLLLFTVAVSIVMRPRGHDRPPELSHHFGTHHVDTDQVDTHHEFATTWGPARGALV